MDYENNGEQKLSKYNSAVAQLFRIDNLWQSAQLHARSGQLIKWNWDLDTIWRELASDATDKDFKAWKKLNNQLPKIIKARHILYQLLIEKEICLRKLQNQQGKGTAYINPDDDLLEDL